MGAEDGGVDPAVGRLGPVAEGELEPMRQRVCGEDVVPAPDERLHEEKAGKPAADDEHAPAWDPLDGAEDTGKRLREGPGRVVDVTGERDRRCRPRALGEAAGHDRRRREALAGRLVAGPAALALPARQVVDERDSPPLRVLGDDLVAEDGAGRRASELLQVGSAKPAGANAHELPGAVRLR